MSEKTKTRIEFAALLVGLLMSAGGMFGAFYLLPYRMDAMENRVGKITEQRQGDRELLLRIEERLIAMQREINGRTRQ